MDVRSIRYAVTRMAECIKYPRGKDKMFAETRRIRFERVLGTAERMFQIIERLESQPLHIQARAGFFGCRRSPFFFAAICDRRRG